eukprot:9158972-Heterocapsa_arctica.AAC.1
MARPGSRLAAKRAAAWAAMQRAPARASRLSAEAIRVFMRGHTRLRTRREPRPRDNAEQAPLPTTADPALVRGLVHFLDTG